MITREDAATYFRQLLGAKASWAKLASSQFVGHLSVFVSWCLREALWRLERLNQEFFISTAINDSSIMAHAEDREYVPRKRIPATGTITVLNTGTAVLSLPIFTEFTSPDDLTYMTIEAVSVAAGASAVVSVSQIERETLLDTVITAKVFYSYLFNLDHSKRLAGFKVEVDQEGTGDFAVWNYVRLFQNSWHDDAVYDEFFSHTGQTGVRFGNGLFGRIPPQGSKIRFTLTLTDGDTSLVTGQPLLPVSDLYDNSGNLAAFTAIVATSVENGSEREGTAEMRSNMHYWPTYNEKLVWDDDYIFFIKRNVGGLVWCKAWGETEQEAITGFSVHNINRVFVTGYAPGNNELSTQVMSRLAEVRVLNRHFVWMPPVFSEFHLTITGKVARTTNIPATEADIRAALELDYGKDSASRKDDVFIKDIYSLVNATGGFSDRVSWFDVAVIGKTAPTLMEEMIHIDLATTTITLTYA